MPLDSIQQWRARVGLYNAAYAPRPRRTYSKLQWQRFKDGYLLEALFLVVVKVLLDVIYVCTTGNVVHALTCLIHRYKEWHSGSEVWRTFTMETLLNLAAMLQFKLTCKISSVLI